MCGNKAQQGCNFFQLQQFFFTLLILKMFSNILSHIMDVLFATGDWASVCLLGVAFSLCLAKLFVAVTINKFRIHIIIKCSCVEPVCMCLNFDKFVVAISSYHAVYLLLPIEFICIFAVLLSSKNDCVCVCISWEHLRAHECLHLQMENEVNFQPGGAVWKFAIHFVRENCAEYKLEMREAIVVCNVKPGLLRWWKLKWSWQVIMG